MNTYEMEKSLESIAERLLSAKDALSALDYDDELDLTEDVGLPAVLALSELVSVVNDLREAGADIAGVPADDEALVLAVVNGDKIAAAIKADVEHLEGVIARLLSRPTN